MNVCFKRIKKQKFLYLSAQENWKFNLHFLTFLCLNFTAIKENVSIKIFLTNSAIFNGKHPWSLFFIKFQAFSLQDSNTGIFLWIIWALILKNICEPLTSAFSSQLFEAVGKKPVQKTKWQKLINKYEKKSLKCVIKPVLKTCAEQLILGVEFEIDTYIKSTPIWISYHF